MPTRLIDVPIESLPYVDEHEITIAAPADVVWRALVDVVCGLTSGRAKPVARALGCVPTEHRGEPGRIGSTVPGFIVTRAVPPAALALMGEHRFSRYALVFRIDETPAGPSTSGPRHGPSSPAGRAAPTWRWWSAPAATWWRRSRSCEPSAVGPRGARRRDDRTRRAAGRRALRARGRLELDLLGAG